MLLEVPHCNPEVWQMGTGLETNIEPTKQRTWARLRLHTAFGSSFPGFSPPCSVTSTQVSAGDVRTRQNPALGTKQQPGDGFKRAPPADAPRGNALGKGAASNFPCAAWGELSQRYLGARDD